MELSSPYSVNKLGWGGGCWLFLRGCWAEGCRGVAGEMVRRVLRRRKGVERHFGFGFRGDIEPELAAGELEGCLDFIQGFIDVV